MIFPGSSSETGSSSVPCSRASVRRVPRASAVPSGRSIRAAQMLSRPNRVKNQGAPAARKTSSGVSGVAIRSPCRSSRQRLSNRLSRRSSARMSGFSQVGAAGGRVTAAPTSSMRTSHSRLTRSPWSRFDRPHEGACRRVEGGLGGDDGDAGVAVLPHQSVVHLLGDGLLPQGTELDPVDVEEVGPAARDGGRCGRACPPRSSRRSPRAAGRA